MAGAFDPEQQVNSVPSKIIAGLERIASSFKVLLWEQAQIHGLSPLQVQILLFIGHHKQDHASVGYLAKEFHVSAPTLSDAVKVMVEKELLEKEHSDTDGRRYTLKLTTKGKAVLKKTEDLSAPLLQGVSNLTVPDQSKLYTSILKLIQDLQAAGVISINRNCFNCRFYEQASDGAFCGYLQAPLAVNDIRLDCPEFEKIS